MKSNDPEILKEFVTTHHLTMPNDSTAGDNYGAGLLDTKVQELDPACELCESLADLAVQCDRLVVGRKFIVGEVLLEGVENNLNGVVFVERNRSRCGVSETVANLDIDLRFAEDIHAMIHGVATYSEVNKTRLDTAKTLLYSHMTNNCCLHSDRSRDHAIYNTTDTLKDGNVILSKP